MQSDPDYLTASIRNMPSLENGELRDFLWDYSRTQVCVRPINAKPM